MPLFYAPNGIRGIHFFNETHGIIGGPINPPQSSGAKQPPVLKTLDGGASWDTPEFDFQYAVNTITFVNELYGYVGDINGNIYSTTDGGTTWKNDNVPSGGRSINSIAVAGGSVVYAVGDSGLILKLDLVTSVSMTDIIGKEVFSTTATSPIVDVDMSAAVPAVYCVRVRVGGRHYAHMVVLH